MEDVIEVISVVNSNKGQSVLRACEGRQMFSANMDSHTIKRILKIFCREEGALIISHCWEELLHNSFPVDPGVFTDEHFTPCVVTNIKLEKETQSPTETDTQINYGASSSGAADAVPSTLGTRHGLPDSSALLYQNYSYSDSDYEPDLLASAPQASNRFPSSRGRIIGGEPVEIEDYLYQVSIQSEKYYFCGGFIVSPNTILTAAHCVHKGGVSEFTVAYGSKHLYGGNSTTVNSVEVHEDYDASSHDCDIALLLLSKKIVFDSTTAEIRTTIAWTRP
ncbi:hypothetical protein FQA39_LY15131 [Lamprigera yunnana]|nr:hypothetical protein FQA39_LY15131 [Lamprigera yunnana]